MTISTEAPQKISVIVASYNSQATIEQTITSYIEQSYLAKELIIIDGGSRDQTADIVNRYRHHVDHFISEPDKGVYDAWNKGLKLATGDWICFIGSDDVFYGHNSLATAARHFPEALRNNSYWIYGKVATVDETGNKTLSIDNVGWDLAKKKFFLANNIVHSGSLHHKTLFEVYGNFDITFKIVADYDFLLRYTKNSAPIFIDETLVRMRRGGISTRLDARARGLRELRRARLKNKIPGRSYKLEALILLAPLIDALVTCFGERFVRTGADLYRRALGKPTMWVR